MAVDPITTTNPISTLGAGETITQADAQLVKDYTLLPTEMFDAKYGADTRVSLDAQREANANAARDILIGSRRTMGDLAKDTALGIASGAVTGITGATSLTADLVGARSAAKYLAQATQNIDEGFKEFGSAGQKANERSYQFYQEGLQNRVDREYRENIAKGASSTEAELARQGSMFMHSALNTFKSGQYTQIAAQGLGSILSGGASTAAIKGVGRLGASAFAKSAPKLVERAADAYSRANPIAKKIADASPWMVSMGMQEGGGTYGQQLLDGLNMSHEDLLAHSPQYREALQRYLEAGMSPQEAQNQAREDMAFAAAREAGIETAIAAGAANIMTAGLAKPFQRLNVGAKARSYIGKALEGGTETIEEGLSEGLGQLAQNYSTQKYLNDTQNLWEGVGQSAAEGAVGGLGAVGARSIPATVVEATIDGAKALGSGSRNAAEYVRDNIASAEHTQKKIDKVTQNKDDLTSVVQASDSGNILNAVDSLQGLQDRTNETAEVDGKTVSAVTPDKALDIVKEAQTQKQNVENTSAVSDATKEQQTTLQKNQKIVNSSLDDVQRKAVSTASESIKAQRASYQEGVSLTQPQIDSEGAYLTASALVNPKKAQQEFKALPKTRQEELKKATFSNPEVATKMQEVFSGKITEPTATANETTKPVEVLYASKEQLKKTLQPQIFKNGLKPFEKLSSEQVKALPKGQTQSIGDVDLTYEKGKRATYEYNGETYQIPPEYIPELDAAWEKSDPAKNASPDLHPLVAFARKTVPIVMWENSIPDHQFSYLSDEGTPQSLLISGKTYQLQEEDGTLISSGELSEESQKILSDPSKSPAEKVRSITSLVRRAEDLTPTELAERNKYYDQETGEIKDYDSQEVKDSWARTFGSKLSGLFTPVKRISHLWQSNSPAETFRDLISNPERLLEYLRSNNLTNAKNLRNSLYKKDKEGKYIPIDTNKYDYSRNDSIAQQIVELLNPKSYFSTAIERSLDSYFSDPSRLPPTVRDIVYKDGKLDPKIKDILKIAALHHLSTLGAFKHELDEDELRRIGINPEDQEQPFSTVDGVPELMAVRNAATTIRKFLGVAENPNVPNNLPESFLGGLAVALETALDDAGLTENTQISYLVRQDDGMKVSKTTRLIAPTEEFARLFRPKANVLEQLLDPTMRNAWSATPHPVRTRYVNSTERVTPKTERAISDANNMKAVINGRYASFVAFFGGTTGLDMLYGEHVDEKDRDWILPQTWISNKGKSISRRLGVDALTEILEGNTDIPLEDISVYFNNVAIKNNRIMQVGAATYQNNKEVRQLLNYKNTPTMDLTDPEQFKAWKITLAQKLGISINKIPYRNYEKKIDDFLIDAKRLFSEKENVTLLNQIFNTNPRSLGQELDEATLKDRVEKFKKLQKAFNKINPDLQVSDAEGFNALMEVAAYTTENTDLKKFDSRIFIEVDGTNDGPSYLNALFAMGVSAVTAKYLSISAKTGTFIGVDTNSQEAMDGDSKELLDTDGRDLHKEVSEEKLPEYFFRRLISFNEDANRTTYETTGNIASKSTQNLLKLFAAVGWISPAKEGQTMDDVLKIINGLGNIKDYDPSNPPFKFDREISKQLVTTIGYGAGAYTATANALSQLMDKLYLQIGEVLKANATVRGAKFRKYMNGVGFEQTMTALQELLGTGYDSKESAFIKEEGKDISSLALHLKNSLPTDAQYSMPTRMYADGVLKVKDADGRYVEQDDIRNFRLTQDGLRALTTNCLPIFGEPAVAAVQEVIGTAAMTGSKVPAVLANVLNLLAKSLQRIKLTSAKGDIRNLTQEQIDKVNKQISSISPTFSLRGGTKVVIGKTEFYGEDNPLVKDEKSGFFYTPSRSRITSAGVSGSPLTTQGAGDATMANELLRLVAEINEVIGQVFDGMYTDADKASKLGELANKASLYAQNQQVMTDMYKRVVQVGNSLNKLGYSEKKGTEAVVESLANLASDKNLDGSVNEDSAKDWDSMKWSIKDLGMQLTEPRTFEPNFFKARDIKRRESSDTRSSKRTPEALKIEAQSVLESFFNKLEAMKLNEQLHQKAISSLPKTVHHMAATETGYKDGNPLSVEEAKQLFKDVNAKLKSKFRNWNEMMATYIEVLVDRQLEKMTDLDPAALRTEFWKALNVAYKEIPDPEPTEEEKKAAALEEAKRVRAEAVASIKVAVDGMVFDGDEAAQSRMARALTAAEVAQQDSTVWVLADNTVATVTKDQLAKALAFSMQEMAKVWTLPYTGGDAAE